MNSKTAIKKLRSFYILHKRLPSYKEMCSIFGFASKNACFLLVKKLIQTGFLEKDDHGKLIPKQLIPALPVLGVIPAGSPIDAEQQLLDTLSVENYLIGNPEKSYILKVTGDSMIGAGIYPGDLVILEKEKQPKNGDIIAAYIDNAFTLKYFQKINGKVVLLPANEKYAPLYPQENLVIFGIVVSVMRKYH